MLQTPAHFAHVEDRPLPDVIVDRLRIRDLLENWVVWRDSGDWERFASVWHDDGRMNATWFQASASDFIAGCRRGFDAGVIGLHLLGGISIDVRGARAVAQSKMQIIQLLGSFPVGYRHLGYLQTKIGFGVYKNLPGTRGPEMAALVARMKAWLEGQHSACLS